MMRKLNRLRHWVCSIEGIVIGGGLLLGYVCLTGWALPAFKAGYPATGGIFVFLSIMLPAAPAIDAAEIHGLFRRR